MKKNITISIDDDLNELLKEKMKQQNHSKSKIVSDILKTHLFTNIIFGNIEND